MAQERDELVATLEVLKRKLEKGSISKEDFEWMSLQVKKRLDALGPTQVVPGGGPLPTPLQAREDVAELRRIARDQDERIDELQGTVKELEALDSRVREFASMMAGLRDLTGLRKELENRMALQEVKVKELLEKTIELEKYDVQALFGFMERLRGIPEEFATKIEMQEARLRQLLERATSLSEFDVKAFAEGLNEMRTFAQNLVQRVEAQEKTLRELYESRVEAVKRSDLEGLLQSLEGLREQPKLLEQKLAAQEAALKEIQKKAKFLDIAGAPEKITEVKTALEEIKRLGIDKLDSRLAVVDKYDEALQEVHRRLESLAKEQEVRLGALAKKVGEVSELRAALKKYSAWTAALVEEAKLAPKKLEERMGTVESTLTDFQTRVAEIPGAPDLRELKELAARVKPGVEQLQSRMEEVGREMERFRVLVDSGALPDPTELRALRAKAAEAKDQMQEVEASLRQQREAIEKRLGEAQAAVPELAERVAEVAEVTKRLMSLPPGLLERIESVGKEVEVLAGAAEQKRGLEALRTSVTGLEERLQEMSKRLEEVPPPEVLRILQQGLSDLQGSLFGLERKVEEERLQWVSRFEGLQISPDAIDAMAKAGDLAKELGDLPARMKDLEAKTATVVRQEDLETLDTVVEELQSLPKKVEKDLEALRGQVKAMEAKTATVVRQEDLEGLDALVGELQSLPKKVEGDLAAVAGRVEALERAVPSLGPEDVAALKAAAEELRGLPREVEGKVEALGQRLGTLEQAAAGLPRREEVEGLKAAVEEVRGLPKETEKSVLQITQRLESLEKRGQEAATRQELRVLAEEVRSLPGQVEGRLESLGQKVATLESAAASVPQREEFEPIRALAEELRALPEEVEKRMAALEGRLDPLEAAGARADVEALRAAVEEVRGLPKEMETRIGALGQRLGTLEARDGDFAKLRALAEGLKGIPAQLEGRLEALGRKVGALETSASAAVRREEVEGLARRLETSASEFRSRQDSLNAGAEALSQKVGALEAQSNRFATREQVEPLSARVEELGGLAGKLAGLKSGLQEARAALERGASKEQVQSIQKRVEEVGRRLDGLGSEVRKGAEGLRGELKALEERAAALDHGLGEARVRLGDLPPAELLKRTIEEVEGLKEFPAFAEARLSGLASALESLRGRETGAEKRLDDLRKSLEPLRGRLDSVGSKTEETLKGLRELRKFPEEARRRMDGLRSELQARAREASDLQGRTETLEQAAARFAPADRVAVLEEEVGRITAQEAEAGERLRKSLETTHQVAGLARLAVESGERTRADLARWQSEITEAQERLADEHAQSRSQVDATLRAAEERQAQDIARVETEWKGTVAGLGQKVEAWRNEAEARTRGLEGRLGAASDALRAGEERQVQELARVEAESKGVVAGLGERIEAWKAEVAGTQERLASQITETEERLASEHDRSLSKLDATLRALQARVEEAQGALRDAEGRAAAAEQRLDAVGGAMASHGKSLEEIRIAGAAREADGAELKSDVERLQETMRAADAREAEGLARVEAEWKGAEARLGQRVETLGTEARKEQEALAGKFQRSVEEVRSALEVERVDRSRTEARLTKAEEAVSTVPALKESVDLAAAQFRQRSGALAEEVQEVRAALDAGRQSGERTAAGLAQMAEGAAGTARGLDALRTEVARAGQEATERETALERRTRSAEESLDGLRQRAEEATTRKELQAWGVSVMEVQKGLQAHLDDQLQHLRRAQKEAADGTRSLESRLKEIPAEIQRTASAHQQPLERRLELLEGAHRTLRDLGESRFASVDRRLRELAELPARMEDLGAKQEQALDSLHQRVGALREAHQTSEQRAASLHESLEGLRREQADLTRAAEAQQARGEETRLALERRLDQFAQQQEIALQGLRNLVRVSSADIVEGRVKALEAGQDEVLHHVLGQLRTFEREVADLREVLDILFRSRDGAALEVQGRRVEGALQELRKQAESGEADRGAIETRLTRLEGLREGLQAWRAYHAEADEARRRTEAQEKEAAAMGALLRTLADRLKVAEEGFHSMRGGVEQTLRGLADTDAKVIEDLADVKGLLGRLVEMEASLRRLQAMVDSRGGDVAAGMRV